MITFKDLLIFLGSAGLLVCEAAASNPGQLNFRVSPDQIQPGSRASVEIRLSRELPKELSSDVVEPVINDAYLTDSKAYQVLKKEFIPEKSGFIWRYEITAYEPGEIAIPPVEIQYGSFSLSTERKVLKVSNTRTENDEGLREEFDRVHPPWDWRKWMKWIFFSIVAGGFTALVAVYLPRSLKRKIKPVAPLPPIEPSENDLDWLRRKLVDLRRRLSDDAGDEGIYVDEVSLVLRQFFSRKLSLPIQMWTTSELTERLSADPGVSKLIPIFVRCDHFKFAEDRRMSGHQITMNAIEQAEGVIALYV